MTMQPTARKLIIDVMHDAFKRGFFQSAKVLTDNATALQMELGEYGTFIRSVHESWRPSITEVRIAAEIVKSEVLPNKTMNAEQLKVTIELIETLAHAFVAYPNPAQDRKGSLRQFELETHDIPRWTSDVLHAHSGNNALWAEMNGRLLLGAANIAEVNSGPETAIMLYAGASIGGAYSTQEFILRKFADAKVNTPSPKEDTIALQAYMGAMRCALMMPGNFHYVEKIAEKIVNLGVEIPAK